MQAKNLMEGTLLHLTWTDGHDSHYTANWLQVCHPEYDDDDDDDGDQKDNNDDNDDENDDVSTDEDDNRNTKLKLR